MTVDKVQVPMHNLNLFNFVKHKTKLSNEVRKKLTPALFYIDYDQKPENSAMLDFFFYNSSELSLVIADCIAHDLPKEYDEDFIIRFYDLDKLFNIPKNKFKIYTTEYFNIGYNSSDNEIIVVFQREKIF